MTIKLGQKVRDIVSGIEGIATSRVEFLNGCVRYAVHPPVDKDGKHQESVYVDEEQLVAIGSGVTDQLADISPSGGDRPDPVRERAPTQAPDPRVR